MSLWNSFLGFFKDDGTLELDVVIAELSSELLFKQIALEACINLIAKTLSRTEFRTYREGKEIKENNYYLFNVEPNHNESSTQFWSKVLSKMIKDNECLVIQHDGQFFVADEYTVAEKNGPFKQNRYTNIKIGNHEVNGSYDECDILKFVLHSSKIKTLLDGINSGYGKLIEASTKRFKRDKAKRGTFEVPANYPLTDKAQNDLKDLLANKVKTYFEAEAGAALPLTNGIKFKESEGSQKDSISRDIRHLIDDVYDFVAIAFQIPPQLIKGNVADTSKAVDQFITFGFSIFTKIIEDETNRKVYGKEAYLKKTYLRIDSTRIKHIDLKTISNAMEVLTRIGVHCVDDNLKLLGMQPLETEWGQARFMTKNYERIEKFKKGDDG